MKIGPYFFTPRPLFMGLYLVVASAMCALGIWQLHRADEKIELQNLDALASQAAPSPLHELDLNQLAPYTLVRMIGQFEPAKQFLWDNRINQGVAGYEIITPFRLADTRGLVLVNRGWKDVGGSRAVLPDVGFAEPATVTIIAKWTKPSIGFSRGDAVNSSLEVWPRVLQHFDYAQISQAMGEAVPPGLLQIVRTPDLQVDVPLYPDNWQPVASGPERHYGYAFQWFAMLAALTYLFVKLNLQRNPVR